MTSLEEALLEVTSCLESLSIPHMLIGGLAVSLWGEPRATLDIDLILWVEPEKLELTVQRLCERFHTPVAAPREFVELYRILPLITAQGVRADLIFASLPYERHAIDRAATKDVAGRPLRVAAVEDLLLMKAMSEREKDLEDARRLVRRHAASLDRRYLEPLLRQLAEAMARPDILNLLP